jgi:hypothetical protein
VLEHEQAEAKLGVWSEDSISPAANLFCCKVASPQLLWQSAAVSRVVFDTCYVTLEDSSLLKIHNDFIGHYTSNSEEARIRGFTTDTIPISIMVGQ